MSFRDQIISRTDIPVAGKTGSRIFWVMALRVLLISVLLGATLFVNYSTGTALTTPSPRFLLGLIAFTYIVTIVYAVWYRTGRNLDLNVTVQFFVDALLWGGLVYATGGVTSGFTFLFDLWVIVAAVVLGGRAAFAMSAISSVVLTALATLMFWEILPSLDDQLTAVVTDTNGILYSLFVNVAGLFLVAGLVSSLVARLERTGRGLEQERVQRADLTALYSDVIRSLTVGLVTAGEGGEIFTMNPEGRMILGLRDVSVDGLDLSRWLPDIKPLIKGDRAVETRGHGVAQRDDGRKVPIEYVIAPLLNADKHRQGSIVIFSDLSKVKRLESALENARRLAALGELAASLAHEIRNPLSAVYGSVQMLSSNKGFNEEDSSLLDIVLRELRRVERLVNDMLEYTRPRDPSMLLTDVGDLAAQVARAFSLGSEGEGVDVKFDACGDTVASVDEGQIRQVVWNLLRNAAQATGEGGVIEVLVSEGEESVELVISDDGPGITPENRTKVLDPFFSTRERGMGLGLAICNRVAEAHGSKLMVEQSESGGALFRLALPKISE